MKLIRAFVADATSSGPQKDTTVKRRPPRFSFGGAKAIAGGVSRCFFGRCLAGIGGPACFYLNLLRGLLLPCIVAFPSLAQAGHVLLVQPSGSDATTLETFNRLRGELHVHGFQVLIVESANEARTGAADLAAMTELHGALAGVCPVRGSKPASVEIWMAARGTGSTGIHTIFTSAEKDAPLLLAIRVVDLLRTNLREYAGDDAPASGTQNPHPRLVSPEVASSAGSVERTEHASRPAGPVTGDRSGNSPSSPGTQDSHQAPAVKRSPVSPPVEKATRSAAPREQAAEQPADQGTPAHESQDSPPALVSPAEDVSVSPVESAYRFSLSGGLVASFDYHLGVGLGPALSANYTASQLLGISLGFIGPVFGQSYEDTTATARVREEMLFVLVSLSAWRRGRIAQNVFIGPGGMHIAVQGEAQQPLAGRASSTWVGLAQAGTGISYQALPRLRIELSVSALLLVPRPAIEIDESHHPMSDPQFLSCLALHLGL